MSVIDVQSPPFELSESERRNFAVRPELSLVEWAARHMMITEGPMSGATWSPETFPLQRTPMESVQDKRWSRTILMTGPQAWGKTQAVGVTLPMYAIEYLGVNAMYVAGTAELADAQWNRKIAAAIDKSPQLSKLLYENPDQGGTKRERRFTNGTSLFMVGAESVGALSGKTAAVLVCDDVQAFPVSLPRFGHPADYAVSRTEAFSTEQIMLCFIGTAGTVEDWLWRSMLGSALFCPFVPCPKCGTYQLIEFDRFEFDRDDPVAARQNCYMRCANDDSGDDRGIATAGPDSGGVAGTQDNRAGRSVQGRRRCGNPVESREDDGYQSGDEVSEDSGHGHGVVRVGQGVCSHRITFDDLPAMLDRHLWVSTPPDADWILNPPAGGVTIDPKTADVYPDTHRNTSAAGFWCNAFYWPLGKTWDERAAEWLGIQGDPDKLKTFGQNILVKPWAEPEIDEEALTEDELKAHAAPGYVAGTVPQAADVVTVTIDVQSGYVYYLVRAWNKGDGTSWLIELGTKGKPLRGRDETEPEKRSRRALLIAHGLDAVDELCVRGWDTVDDKGEVVGHIDQTLGLIDRGYEPDVVAGWHLARHRGVWRTIRGQKAGARASLWPLKPTTDTRRRPFRFVDVNQGKHTLRRLLRVPAGGPGHWHIPSDGIHSNTWRAYHRHMTSERFNRTLMIPRWEPITPGAATHYWDDEVYQVCAAVACGVRLPGLEPKPQRTRRSWRERVRRR